MTIDDVLRRFERATKTGDQWLVRCPAHEDRKASLAVREGEDGRVLLHCHAGCSAESIVATSGLSMADLFPPKPTRPSALGEIAATYDYTDRDGVLVYQVVRYKPKGFRQRCPDGAGGWTWKLNGVPRVLYRLPDLNGREAVVICEGEKDSDRLWLENIPATSNVGGAGKWRDEYATQLKTAGVRRVRVIPDNDTPGRDHADQVTRSCLAAGLEARIVALPGLEVKQDVSDFLATHSASELRELLKSAPIYAPAVVAQSEAPAPVTPMVLADLLQALANYITKYVVLSREQTTAVVLWVTHTHLLAAADCTPYLQITSATKQAGKTRLLEVLQHVVANPWFTGRLSAAVLIRKVHAQQPTLLLDESDAAFQGEKEYAEALRGILNTGYRRGGCASLCVRGKGGDFTFQDFSTFGPKAIAGIGTLPDTVADRSITIKLQRKKSDEPCARWREKFGRREAAPLQQACHASATPPVIDACRIADPTLPMALSDRQMDVWEPLLAIADLAGGEWPTWARSAAVALAGNAEDTDVTVELLRDIATHVLDEDGDAILSTTKDLIPKLVALEDRPWASWRQDKPITARGIARLLGPLGIHPAATRSVRGYRREVFLDVIARYLPSYVSQRHNPNEIGPESRFSIRHTEDDGDASKSPKKPVDIEIVTQRHIEAGGKGMEGLARLPIEGLGDPEPPTPERFEL